MSDAPILVLGASGKLGEEVVRQLQDAGYTTRRATRNPDGEHPEQVRFHWGRHDTWAAAVAGCRQVFVTAQPLDITAAAVVPPFLDVCRQAGVGHAVFSSALGADLQQTGPLGLVESYLQHCGLDWTILRPNFFMENFSHGWLLPDIKASGRINLAAGAGRTSFVSVQDVAAVVVEVFADASLRGQTFDLTGDDPRSHTAVAAALTRASGRPVNYHEQTEAEMRQAGRRAGLPGGQLEYLLALYAMVRDGLAARKTDTVARLLARKPRQFQDFAEANADAWRVAG